jgi:hypothetical protein
MNKLILIALIIAPFFSKAQSNKLAINYGLITTKYLNNNVVIKKNEFKSILQKDEIAYNKFKQGRLIMGVSNVITIPAFLILIASNNARLNGDKTSTGQWVAGIGGVAFGTLLYYVGQRQTTDAVKIYNENKKFGVHLISTEGIGIALNF